MSCWVAAVSPSDTLLDEVEPPAHEAMGVGLRHEARAFEPFQHGQTHVLTQPAGTGRFRDANLIAHPQIHQELLETVESFCDVRAD